MTRLILITLLLTGCTSIREKNRIEAMKARSAIPKTHKEDELLKRFNTLRALKKETP